MNKKPIVINLFAGPSCGKSTMAGSIFGLLKLHNVKCEYIQEFARDLVYENRINILNYDQIYIFSKQYTKMIRTQFGKVKPDVLITDSPLLLSLVYGKKALSKHERMVILEAHFKFNNHNIFLRRNDKKPFFKMGRNQNDIRECKSLDIKIKEMLRDISHIELSVGPLAINTIVGEILDRFGIEQRFHIDDYIINSTMFKGINKYTERKDDFDVR